MEKVEFKIPEFNLDDVVTSEEELEQENLPQDDLPEPEIVEEEEEVEESFEPSDESNIISPVFNYYKDKNYFDVLGEDIKPPENEEEFFELLEKRDEVLSTSMLEDIHKGYLSSVPEYVQPILEAVINLPEESKLSKEQFTKLLDYAAPSEITEDSFSDRTIAENYIKEHYESLRMPEETVEDIISSLKDTNKLEDAAKTLFLKESQSKKGILDKFVSDANKVVTNEKQRQEQFNQQFSQNFQSLNWRDDRKKFIAKEYNTGNWEKRLEHLKKNPQVLHHLIDFVGRYNGRELDLDSYAKTLESKVTKKVDKKIKSYFNKPVVSSTETATKTNVENLDFDLTHFNL